MTSVVLDSFPSADIHIPPAVEINTSPAYSYGKNGRGRPILGAPPKRPSYFVPMGDTSPSIKKLLKMPEQNKTTVKLIKSPAQTGKAKTEIPMVRKKVYNADFKREAKDYLKMPNHNQNNSYFSSRKAKVPITIKNSSNLASIIAATDGPKKPRRSQPKLLSKKPQITKPPERGKEKRMAARIKKIKKKLLDVLYVLSE